MVWETAYGALSCLAYVGPMGHDFAMVILVLIDFAWEDLLAWQFIDQNIFILFGKFFESEVLFPQSSMLFLWVYSLFFLDFKFLSQFINFFLNNSDNGDNNTIEKDLILLVSRNVENQIALKRISEKFFDTEFCPPIPPTMGGTRVNLLALVPQKRGC